MGLGGFILGGALAGAGKGMQQKVEEDALERRDRRLAEARMAEQAKGHEYSMEQQADQYARADTNAAKDDQRGLSRDLIVKDVDYRNQSSLAAAGAAAEEADREDRQAFEKQMLGLKQGFDASEASKQRAWDTQQELGKPIGQEIDEATGEPVLFFRDPKAKSGVRTVRVKGVDGRKPATSSGSGGGSLLENRGESGAKPTRLPSQNAALVYDPNTGEFVPNKAK